MAPGRPAAPKSPTKYLNSKRRTIWHVTGTNKYVAKSEKGTLVYNPKVRYVKSPGGSERLLTNTKARPPSKIRPKEGRRMRVNRGMKRGAHAGVHTGNLARLFSSPKRRGRPPKAPKSPNFLPNPHLRRPRKNKGMKRGPRMGLSLQKLFKQM